MSLRTLTIRSTPALLILLAACAADVATTDQSLVANDGHSGGPSTLPTADDHGSISALWYAAKSHSGGCGEDTKASGTLFNARFGFHSIRQDVSTGIPHAGNAEGCLAIQYQGDRFGRDSFEFKIQKRRDDTSRVDWLTLGTLNRPKTTNLNSSRINATDRFSFTPWLPTVNLLQNSYRVVAVHSGRYGKRVEQVLDFWFTERSPLGFHLSEKTLDPADGVADLKIAFDANVHVNNATLSVKDAAGNQVAYTYGLRSGITDTREQLLKDVATGGPGDATNQDLRTRALQLGTYTVTVRGAIYRTPTRDNANVEVVSHSETFTIEHPACTASAPPTPTLSVRATSLCPTGGSQFLSVTNADAGSTYNWSSTNAGVSVSAYPNSSSRAQISTFGASDGSVAQVKVSGSNCAGTSAETTMTVIILSESDPQCGGIRR